MSPNSRQRFVALATIFVQRFPDLVLETEVHARRLWVDGQLVTNPNTRVRADAGLRLREHRKLHGSIKLEHALSAFEASVAGRACADVGATAGGFTSALLAAGAARVYAIDVGVGQLRGRLRADPRVVNLEGRNLGALSACEVPESIGLITIDLSYLSIALALPQLDVLDLAAGADLVALVKPTFELRSGTLAKDEAHVRSAIAVVRSALEDLGWKIMGTTRAPRTGRRGAVEALIHARRL